MSTGVLDVDLENPDDIVDALLHRAPLAWPGDDTPWDLYRALREQAPVFASSHGMWIMTRYRDALALLRHPTDLGMRMRAEAEQGVTVAQLFAPTMLYFEDPADTMRQRRLMRGLFTREAVHRRIPEIEGLVDPLLDRCAQKGSFDFHNDFSDHIPVAVMCSLLGVPSEDVPIFRDWTRTSAPATGAVVDEETARQVEAAFTGLRDYMADLLARRRRNLGEHDLLSVMIRASQDSEEALSSDELIGLAIFTLAAGSDTTTQLMTGAMNTLSRFPDEMRGLHEDLSTLPDALEELLRHSGPVHYTQPRKLRAPLVLDDVEIPEGETVLAYVAAANRDPAQFPDPDRLDLRREDTRHLGFSQGMHLCIGAMLARLEAEIGLRKAFERFAEIEVEQDPVPYVDYGTMRGIRELRVTAKPA